MSLTKAKWTEELLRQSFLSEELIDIHFHLFSGRSISTEKVVHARTLHANAIFLKRRARYFVDCQFYSPVTSSLKLIIGNFQY